MSVNQAKQISNAWGDADERLRGEGVHFDLVHWVGDASGLELIAAAQPHKSDKNGAFNWQLLSWYWVSQRMGWNPDETTFNPKALLEELFPWLMTVDQLNERRQLQEALERDHTQQTENLTHIRLEFERENERLRSQNAALQQVDAERLARFLPALYVRVFTVLGGADLALLCGRIEPIDLPNPYPEPSEETLLVLQRDFRNLPQKFQKDLIDFVNRLPQSQKLQVRLEMRDVVRQLKGI